MAYLILVDGDWSNWSEWSSCFVTCGDGTQSRDRTCTDPAPENGGSECLGEADDFQPCINTPCPGKIIEIKAHLGFMSCMVKITFQTFSWKFSYPRTPLNFFIVVNGGYSSWSDWDTCSDTCGGGTKTRARDCTDPVPAFGGENCTGHSEESQTCSNDPCPGILVH